MVARTSVAQETVAVSKRTGVELALRSGYALPFGEAQKGEDLADDVARQIPLELDVGYRDEHYTYGIYLQYGFGSPGEATERGCNLLAAECPVSTARGGFQIIYHFLPKESVAGWISGTLGAEYIHMSLHSTPAEVNYSAHYFGIETLGIQAGLDFRAQQGMSIGPYLGVLTGWYLDFGNDCTGRGCSSLPYGQAMGDISSHNWFVAGVRGSWLL